MKRDERQVFWEQHVAAWRASGKSQANYCRTHHLHVVAFGRWLKQLSKSVAEDRSRFVRVVAAEPATAMASNVAVSVELAGGVRLTLTPMSTASLAELIASLRGALA